MCPHRTCFFLFVFSCGRYGVILKQVAHFYNNIRSQIIDSQMLMLETYARDLEAVIKGPKGKLAGKGGSAVAVTWDSADELDQYANCRAGVLPSLSF